jgi:hypothetical protein
MRFANMRHHNNEEPEGWPERRPWLTDERFVKIVLLACFVITITLILLYATSNPTQDAAPPCYKY